MHPRLRPLLGLLMIAPALSLRAQQPVVTSTTTRPVPTLRAVRRDGPVLIDGKLNDDAWAKAPVANQFIESYPHPDRAAVDPTEVRVLYDNEALYVAVRMFDSHPDSIAAQLARRDAGGIYSDWLHLIVDSYHDRRTAFRFTVNPKGVQKDVFTSNDGNEDLNWDAVWDVATRVDSVGWVAEYRIPLSQLRFGDVPRGQERVWGFQIMRDVARRNERTSFSRWDPNEGGFVSRFGDLTGLVDIEQPQRLEVTPYVSMKVTRAQGDEKNPFFHKTDGSPSIGGDVRYGLPGGLTLTGTINPDFGQVEVDPAVVNLSAFESFFPEKRPFFLEGADIFNFGQVIRNNDFGSHTFFYTRRIGRPPQLFPAGPGIAFVDMPEQTPIAGAAKLTGKMGQWTLGLLDAVTPTVRAGIAGPSGARDSTTAVDPLTNYFAGRLRRDFRNGGSVLGGMLTLANRQQSDAFRPILTTSGGYGGLDFEHRMKQNTWVTSGFAVRSQVNGSNTVIGSLQRNSTHYFQRPDAGHLTFDPTRTSLAGHAEEVAIQKNGTVFGSLAVKNVSPDFEINDVGFHGRVDYRAISPFLGYSSSKSNGWSQNRFVGVWWNGAWNSDPVMLYRGYGAGSNATLKNFQSLSVNLNFAPTSYSDRLLRGGPVALTPGQLGASLGMDTDKRKPVWFGPNVGYNRNIDDPSWNASGRLHIDTRPSSTFHLTFDPGISKALNTSQYSRSVTDALATSTYGARYVFANLNQTTVSMDTRVDWTLTSRLSLQSYFQPFVSVGRYTDYKEFVQPRTYDFAVYGRDRGSISENFDAEGHVVSYTVDPDAAGPATSFTVTNRNFNVHSLRGNAVIRWEYRPGSAVFFVWQQERGGADAIFDFDASRDIGAIFREVPRNTFLVKATYWLSR